MHALSALILLVLLAGTGCSSRTPAAAPSPQGMPPRPALGAPIDRVGRPLTGNALLGLFASEEVSNRRKEQYNRAAQAEWPQFIDDIQHSLALYDSFDGTCGNQWLADRNAAAPVRYRALATLLADDRLWIDSRSAVCAQYLAIELAGTTGSPGRDCGGRTLDADAVDVFRSLLALGKTTGLDDGIAHDDHEHLDAFPFLAAP